MKPTFALDLSRDLIALLHRTPKGWLSIGEVAFDATDLEASLAYLRSTALGLSPLGVATKIILPASQVLYIEVHAPGPSREEKRRQIAAALEGRTPYAVEDLVFDWSGKGGTVKVAVVARETLDEAEAFAIAHRMNPVSTVAIPTDGAFVGEPWFGPTAAAAATLSQDETVERDREPVVLLQRNPAPVVAPVEAEAEAEAEAENVVETLLDQPQAVGPAASPDLPPAPLADAAAPDQAEDSLPGLEAALNGELSPIAADAPAPLKETETYQSFAAAFAAAGSDQPDRDGDLDADADSDSDADALERSLSAALADVAGPALSAKAVTAVTPASDGAEADEAPFAHVTDTSAFPDADDDLPPPAAGGAGKGRGNGAEPALDAARPAGLADDIPPAQPSAVMMAFASRRAAAGPVTAPPLDAPSRSAATAGTIAKPAVPLPSTRPAPAKGFAGLVTAPSIPGTRAKPKVKTSATDAARPSGPGASTVRSPARPGGTFGTSAPPRNRTGVVFLVLVALLLVCLALLAAWASMFLERSAMGRSAQTELAQSAVPDNSSLSGVVSDPPAIEDEMLADLQDPAGLTDPLPEAQGQPLAGGDAGALATESTDLTQLDDTAAPINLAPQDATDLPEGTLASVTDTAAAEAAAAEAVAAEALAAEEAAAAEALVAEAAAAEAAEAEAAAIAAAALPIEPAPGTTVTTDLDVAAAPVEDQDEIFLSAMDAPPPALDALALPVPRLVADTAPEAPMPPPAFGTVYQFDAQGLLVPTPDGILSPDGVMLIAGPPPLVPPARSEVAAAAAAARALEVTPEASAEASAEAAAASTAPPATEVTAADASLVTAGEAVPPPAPDTPPDATPDATPDAAVDPTLAPAPADPALAGFRPRARPDGLGPASEDDASLSVETNTAIATLRPLPRPASVLSAASASRPADKVLGLATADLGAQGASLAAQAEARLAAAAALEAENPSIVAISMRPAARPRDLSSAVEAAVAAAVRAPDPEAVVIATAAALPPDLKPEELDELNEPEVVAAAPSIPSKASVAKQATFDNAINLSRINLIGTYGTDSRRYALVRQSNGRYKKVQVGDKIDGGTVQAITETEVRYQKGGKLISLVMPRV